MRAIYSYFSSADITKRAGVVLAVLSLAMIPAPQTYGQTLIVPRIEWMMPLAEAPFRNGYYTGDYPAVVDVDQDGIEEAVFASRSLYVIDLATGDVKQTISLGEPIRNPIPYSRDRILVNSSSTLYGIRPGSDQPIWSKSVPGTIIADPIVRIVDDQCIAFFGTFDDNRNSYLHALNLETSEFLFKPCFVATAAGEYTERGTIQGISTGQIDGDVCIGVTSGSNTATSHLSVWNLEGSLISGGFLPSNPQSGNPPSFAKGGFLFGTWGPGYPEVTWVESGALYWFTPEVETWVLSPGFPARLPGGPVYVNTAVPCNADTDADLEFVISTVGHYKGVTTGGNPTWGWSPDGEIDKVSTDPAIHIINEDGSPMMHAIPIGKHANQISIFGSFLMIPTLYHTVKNISGSLEIRSLETGELVAAPFLDYPNSEYSGIVSPATIFRTRHYQVGLLFTAQTWEEIEGQWEESSHLVALTLDGLHFDPNAQLWQPDGNFHRNREYGYKPTPLPPELEILEVEDVGEGVVRIRYRGLRGNITFVLDPDNIPNNDNEIPITGAHEIESQGLATRLFQISAYSEEGFFVKGIITNEVGEIVIYTSETIKLMPATFAKLYTPIKEGVSFDNPLPGEIFPITYKASPDDQVELYFRTETTSALLTTLTGHGDTRQYMWDVGQFIKDRNLEGTIDGTIIAKVTESNDPLSIIEAQSPGKLTITVTPALPGDFDKDGDVDFPDFIAFAQCFGASIGQENYDRKYDLDGKGSVDFPDFIQFAQNFGK